VRLTELFERLVTYRNRLLGHAAPGALTTDFHERMAGAMLDGVAEVLGKLDVLAGRRLLHIGEVRQSGGVWLVPRFELVGEAAQRIASLELSREQACRLPDGNHLYLDDRGAADPLASMVPLHPLLLYDDESGAVLFLNSRKGKRRTEYLCYGTGAVTERPDLGGAQRALLAKVLGMDVAESMAAAWAAHSRAEEPPEEARASAPLQMGEYELLSELGRGGMGVVYRAWQPSLGRQVALKFLLRVGDSKADARFRREIRALGKVDHPNLVKVYASGGDGDRWFYAMELIEGVPLRVVSDRLRNDAGTTVIDLPVWRRTLSTVCDEARRAEKPLSSSPPHSSGVPESDSPSSTPLSQRNEVKKRTDAPRRRTTAPGRPSSEP
jgi:hypothetical protein